MAGLASAAASLASLLEAAFSAVAAAACVAADVLTSVRALAAHDLENALHDLQLASSGVLVFLTLSAVLLQQPQHPLCETRFCHFYSLRHACRLPNVASGGRPRRRPKIRCREGRSGSPRIDAMTRAEK